MATIDGTAYDTLAAAIAAVPDSGATPTTITLNSDATGGVKINGDKNVILDLNSHTYNVVQGVGSTGTETNGMQLIKQHRGHQERHHDGQRERGPALHDQELR